MVRWPEPDRPGFVAFHCDHRDGSLGRPEDGAYFDFPKVIQYMREVLTAPGNYFGLIDQFGVTLQFMVNDAESVRVEIPDPARKGSMTTDASLEDLIALISGAGPSLAELVVPGLVFEPWE